MRVADGSDHAGLRRAREQGSRAQSTSRTEREKRRRRGIGLETNRQVNPSAAFGVIARACEAVQEPVALREVRTVECIGAVYAAADRAGDGKVGDWIGRNRR